MAKIGILAYGSLIEDPGAQLCSHIVDRITNVKTPFNIEFARSSSTRGGAPTVIPVESGGAPVNATILVLNEGTTLEKAKDLVWRRETRNEDSDKPYERPTSPGLNNVLVESIQDFAGFDCVLYTKIGANINPLNAKKIANLAINSAKGSAGKSCEDGIHYLRSLKRQGVTTPLMVEYENEILTQTGTNSLEDAIKLLQKHQS